jgi:hypothetical protein
MRSMRAVDHPVRVLVFDDGRLAGIVTPTDGMRTVQRAPSRTPETIRGAA